MKSSWTGVNDQCKEGEWLWPDSSPVNATYWAPKQPDNWPKYGGENCVHILDDGNWNDATCNVPEIKMNFICQKCKQQSLGNDTFENQTLNLVRCTEMGNITWRTCKPDCKPGPADIIFLVDTSTSASKSLAQRQEVIKHFIQGLPFGKDDFLFATLRYGMDVLETFNFKKFSTKKDMIRVIENMENRNGPTYTANAFKKAKEMFQDSSSGSRPNADKFVVLLYDGLSTDRFDLHAEAVRLKRQRIKIIPIGIGSSVAHTELINVAHAKDYAFVNEQYKHALSRLIVSTIGESCSNHAFNKQADVIFLLDVKQKQSKDGFNNRRDLIKKILEYLFGWNFDLRIALATYSDNPMFIATLGWSSDLNELIRVSVVPEKSSNSTFSRTAEALKFVGDEGFSRSVSYRTKARKLVLLLTDAEWDSPGEIKKVVKDLKSRNISVVGIASGEDVNLEQFSFILSDPSQLIFIPEFSKSDPYVSLNALNSMASFYSCDDDIFE